MADKPGFGKMRINETEVAHPTEGVYMIPGFGNTGLVETEDGLVLVDMPVAGHLENTMTLMRQTTAAPVHTVFLTHGHLDHAVNLDPLFDEANENGWSAPRVVAQRNLLRRLNKYRMLHGFHEHINRIQFNFPECVEAFPLPTHNPDVLFDQSISMSMGGLDFHAYHGLGETDDALWLWVPKKKAIFAGDMVILGLPNVGNPFKVQRYTLEWAEALEAMEAKEPEVLIPGHGPAMTGREKIREALLTVSKALRYLHTQVVDLLNQGMWYDDILHAVDLPPDMKESGYLAPIYGHPKFIIHGVLRQYAGWYDGTPANLFPPKKAAIQTEIASLVGAEKLMGHAKALFADQRLDMAIQFVDLALAVDLAPHEARDMHALKAEILGQLGRETPSFISKSIYFIARDQEVIKSK